MLLTRSKYFVVLFMLLFCACSQDRKPSAKKHIFKGLYSYGPEQKSFKSCDDNREYWVADSSFQLELKYTQMNFEKPYEPVYVELEGTEVATENEGASAEFDSTLIVRKVIKITKEIPEDLCN